MQAASDTMLPPAAPTDIATTMMPNSMNIQEVIALTSRLAQLLSEESELLGTMKVSKIEELQKEKVFLMNMLDAQRKLIDQHPNTLDTIPSRDKKDLEEVAEVFNHILAENHRKLLLAREVNRKIVKAISDAVKQKTSKRVYNRKGIAGGINTYETLPVTLNKHI